MFWSRNSKITKADRDEREAFEEDTQRLRDEADSLLTEARIVGDAHRKSRNNNHYRLVLDDIFRGTI